MDEPTHDDEPELAGYVPLTGSSLRARKRRTTMRIVVLIAVIALVAPGILTALSIASRTAQQTCAVYVSRYQPHAAGASAHFDLFGPRGPGWDCYTVDSAGNETFLVLLGLIPSLPLPPAELTRES